MKKAIFIALFFSFCVLLAAESLDSERLVVAGALKKEKKESTIDKPPQIPAFGYMKGSIREKVCQKSFNDWQSLSPIDPQGRWYFRITHTDKPKEILDVIGMIEYTAEIDGKKFYFYGVPLENKGNLVRFTDKGAFIRKLKFPVFSFIFLDVELDPEVQYLNFPMKPGDSWTVKAEGIVTLIGFIKIKVPSVTTFTLDSVVNVAVNNRIIKTYVMKSEYDRGDGKIFKEENWFGAGVGLIYAKSEAYELELVRYEPGPDNKEAFEKLTCPDLE